MSLPKSSVFELVSRFEKLVPSDSPNVLEHGVDDGELQSSILEAEEKLVEIESEYEALHELKVRAENAYRHRLILSSDTERGTHPRSPRDREEHSRLSRIINTDAELERCSMLRSHLNYHRLKDWVRFDDVLQSRYVDVHLMLGRVRIMDQKNKIYIELVGESLEYIDHDLRTKQVRFAVDMPPAAAAHCVQLHTSVECRRLFEFLHWIRFNSPVWAPSSYMKLNPSFGKRRELQDDTSSFGSHIDWKLFVGTWNLGGSNPPANLSSWVGNPFSAKEQYDIYVLGFQECGMLDAKVPIADVLQRFFDLDSASASFELLCMESLWEIRLFVIVRRSLRKYVFNVCAETKATGKWGVMGNKGAVTIAFNVLESRYCFFCCHLAARKERILERNESMRLILETSTIHKATLDGNTPVIDDTVVCFDSVFVFGDLNYRTEIDDFDAVVRFAQLGKYEVLKKRDQLTLERRAHNVLCDFLEGEINFRPTYRYNRGELSFSREKLRHPSYCDRILWNASVGSRDREPVLVQYTTSENVLTSDHLPVSATFTIRSELPFASFLESKHVSATLLFSHVRVEPCNNLELGSWSCGDVCAPTLLFDSPRLFDRLVSSAALPSRRDSMSWDDSQVPAIRLLIPHTEYLQSQSIAVALCDEKDKVRTVVGACRISLAEACNGPSSFEVPIVRGGIIKGLLRLTAQVQFGAPVEDDWQSPVEPSQDPRLSILISPSASRVPSIPASGISVSAVSPAMMRVRSLSQRTRVRSTSQISVPVIPDKSFPSATPLIPEVRIGYRLVALVQHARSLGKRFYESEDAFVSALTTAMESLRLDSPAADADLKIHEWIVSRRKNGYFSGLLIETTHLEDLLALLSLDLVEFSFPPKF
eukprot:ANDGO_05932.mRNA.1 Type I inositol polyphosphate 5-phosphatase 8